LQNSLTPMDARTRRRRHKLALAASLAARLNAGSDDDKEAARIRALATQVPQRYLGVDVDDDGRRAPLGYERYVIPALRRYGQATLWWHAQSWSFRVKIDKDRKAKSSTPLLLDDFAKVSGLVARCKGCRVFYAREDSRQRFHSAACAARERQRRRRKRADPEARAAFEDVERRRAAREIARAGRAALTAFYDAKRDAAADAQARRAQAFYRSKKQKGMAGE
jgi:hypothetical protein